MMCISIQKFQNKIKIIPGYNEYYPVVKKGKGITWYDIYSVQRYWESYEMFILGSTEQKQTQREKYVTSKNKLLIDNFKQREKKSNYWYYIL